MNRPTAAVVVVAAMCLGLPGARSFADTSQATLESKLQTIADSYIADTAPGERATAISISVSLPGDAGTVNVASGKVSNAPDAADVTPETLFQIGSITKSFTAVTLLQLQSKGVLDLDDTLGTWLPEYPAWKHVTLRQLLNMTSGIPSYDDIDAMLDSIAKVGLSRHFSPEVLVGFADPSYPSAPAPTTGYSYSNTNYMLAGMVIERATGKRVRENFEERFFGPRSGLTSTYYRDEIYPPEITDRMASGYFIADGYAPLWAYDGADVMLEDMSWAGPAGAIVSRPEQVNRWVRALFGSGDLLDPAARDELTQMVSMKTGKPIDGVTTDDPRGFGLGVSGFASKLGTGWQYEGETNGYRVLYVYLMDKDLIVTIALNSGAEGDADHAGELALAVIKAVEG
ncbi:MAG: beta-lactamase family protein [Thiohalocapsa sp.]|jgi:D-alanyl-D-alanine carboxypeptidase|uniref:serine hydrolase domain-containing protein n=1 Tax=Thiohalocapsa sp. TaxID=2497641 RepID=UPI0025CD1EC3|nr:serine hydrolase domain-containing protein [Thiohalocapsa sp.]MCG6941562.1 beta-lactamase family protein [Thiohalocapsa sp.]